MPGGGGGVYIRGHGGQALGEPEYLRPLARPLKFLP